jgi:hypothetical protein
LEYSHEEETCSSIAATIAGVFRGHLLFTERVNQPRLAVERRRAGAVTLLMDMGLAGALLVDGVRLVVEPATTSGSFNR